MRPLLLLIATLLVTLAASVAPAGAVATCGGRDLMAELAERDPAMHRAILTRAGKIPNAGALLWKVEKPGQAPSHLFGTIHMTDPRVTEMPEAALSALKASKRVALELADMSLEAMQGAMAQSAMLLIAPQGNGLERHLSPSEMQTLRSALTGAGLPDQFASLIRPWVVQMLLSLSDCERERGAAGIRVVDMRIGDLARANGADVIGLETIESQLSALAAVSDAQQIELLKLSLKLSPRRDDMMETMVLLYTRRQMAVAWPLSEALAEKAGTPASAYRSFENELLIKRNSKMRDGVLPLLAQGAAFVAVGALHLQGDTGLVALLRTSGYTVTAIE